MRRQNYSAKIDYFASNVKGKSQSIAKQYNLGSSLHYLRAAKLLGFTVILQIM